MKEDFTTLLLASGTLAALVGTRITWLDRPQGAALPAIVLQQVSDVPDYHMGGAQGFRHSRIQCDCWALTYASVTAVEKALHTLLSGYRGIVGQTNFQAIFIENTRESREAGTNDADRFYRSSVDLIIHHKET
jgi:hypothetical protein